MYIQTIIVGQIATNCYLVSDNQNCILIDPGGEALKIIEQIGDKKLKAILLTHGHFDHVLALKDLCKRYPTAKIYLHKSDQILASQASTQAKMFGIDTPKIDRLFVDIKDGKEIYFGKQTIKIIETPGHTPGSVCYLLDDNLFSGDTLFYRSIGRTDFPGGNMEQMKQSLAKLAKLSDEIKVFPGHGELTIIGNEKRFGFLAKI